MLEHLALRDIDLNPLIPPLWYISMSMNRLKYSQVVSQLIL